MNELKEALKMMAGVGCIGSCEKDQSACHLFCSSYTECMVITDFLDRLERVETDADKVLAGLAELESIEDRRAFIVSYGIVCGMKKES